MLKKVCLPLVKTNTTPLYSVTCFQISSRPFANKARKKLGARIENFVLPEDKQEAQLKSFQEKYYEIYPKKEKPAIDDDDRLAKGYVPPDVKAKRVEKLFFDYKDQTSVVFEEPELLNDNAGGDSRSYLEDVDSQTPNPRERNVDKEGRSYGVGGRKSSRAVARLRPGNGIFLINNRPMVEYFPTYSVREQVLFPFLVTETLGKFDVTCTVTGGGFTGQSGALKMAISRALQNFEPSMRPALKRSGCLERDQRVVERKKPGQPKARKKFQWVAR